jgi:hypothetical protein
MSKPCVVALLCRLALLDVCTAWWQVLVAAPGLMPTAELFDVVGVGLQRCNPLLAQVVELPPPACHLGSHRRQRGRHTAAGQGCSSEPLRNQRAAGGLQQAGGVLGHSQH